MPQEYKLGQLEAILFAAGEPLSVPQLAELLGLNKPQTWELVSLLQEEYEAEKRGLELREVAEGWQKTKYWDSKLKVYRMMGELNPVDAFFIYDKYTTVISTHGLDFKHCDSVKVEEDMTNAQILVDFAKTQIGQTGQRYWDFFGYVDPWCSEFVSYCAVKTGMVAEGLMPKVGNCKQAHDFYKPKGLLHEKGSYTPKSGDIIFFGKEGLDHTAIVEKVADTDITVIEGNAGNSDYTKSKVCRTVYKSNNSWIWGYANPLTKEEVKPKMKDLTKEIEKIEPAYIQGGLVPDEGLEITVPAKGTYKLVTGHNSTPSLNTEWIVRTGGNTAFKVAGTGTMVSVKVTDNKKITVKTTAGHPNVYIEKLS